jgi:hypothetical protein
VDLLVRRQRIGVRAKHAVDLVAGPLRELRVLQRVVDGERQQAAGGLVAGDEEGDALRPDVVVGQLLAALPVDAAEHAAEQVAGARVARLAALADQLVHGRVHERVVPLELAQRPLLQPDHRRRPRAQGL